MIRTIPRAALITDIVVACVMFVVLTPFAIPVYSSWWMPSDFFSVFLILAIVVSSSLLCAGVAVARLAPASPWCCPGRVRRCRCSADFRRFR
ncbi:hypothetical protein [Microbacterium sp. NIBRBAC000506063]|uniref:hypothetical protein n=1 Tax=Microbacterium sp. NIBRBAC000506063 TaxID=2734618 RepID=UPI001BB78DC8|nr:hypothetical protein [Microbacterium sp. NIBRBAC000506063]QTV80096.1 hypothetical protein KAE78_03105 [Microbacterium sp. NIBRBAC000506063]